MVLWRKRPDLFEDRSANDALHDTLCENFEMSLLLERADIRGRVDKKITAALKPIKFSLAYQHIVVIRVGMPPTPSKV